MKRLLGVWLLLAMLSPVFGAVTIYQTDTADAFFVPANGTQVTFTRFSPTIGVPFSTTRTVLKQGILYVPSIASGNYMVNVGAVTVPIFVPDATQTNTLTELNTLAGGLSIVATTNLYTIKVTSADTNAAHLSAKLVAGSNITITTNSPGASETLTIAAEGGGTSVFVAGSSVENPNFANSAELTFAIGSVTNISGGINTGSVLLTKLSTGTSAQLRSIISDETGSGGALVFATAPTILGGTMDDYIQLNEELTPLAPSAGQIRVYGKSDKELYLRDDSSSETRLISERVLTPLLDAKADVSNPLSQFAATTSAQLAGVISDEVGTGSGFLVFSDYLGALALLNTLDPDLLETSVNVHSLLNAPDYADVKSQLDLEIGTDVLAWYESLDALANNISYTHNWTNGTFNMGDLTIGTLTTSGLEWASAVKGNLIAGTGSEAFALLAPGSNGHVLTLDSTEATGMKWAAAGGGGGVGFYHLFRPASVQWPSANAAALSRIPGQRDKLLFDADTAESVYWVGDAHNYGGGTLVAYVTFSMASATANEVQFRGYIDARTPGTDNDDFDTASFDSANEGTPTTVAASAGRLYTQAITLTNKDSIAAGDAFVFQLDRDATDATNDDATGDAEVRYVVIVEE